MRSPPKQIIAVVVLLAILAVGGLLVFGKSLGFGAALGASVISCQQPKYVSSDPFFHNGTFQCTMAATGSGKYLETTLSPDDMYSLFGVRTEQPALISTEVIKDNCRYQFNNVSYPVYQYTIERNKAQVYNGRYVCVASLANPSYGSPQVQAGKGQYLGTTPIQCSSADCHYGSSVNGGCDSVWRKQIGVIYKTDPGGKFYDYAVRINMTLNNQTYSAVLDKANKSVSTGLVSAATEAFRAESLFAGKGDQDCPSPGDTDVAIYVSSAQTTNPLKYISGFQADNLIRYGQGIVDLNTALSSGDSYNTQAQITTSSTPNVGQYLSFATTPATTVRTAAFSLTPATSVSIPVFNLYINAESVGIHVPSGEPKVINASVKEVLATKKANITATVENLGETDSFDVSIQGKHDISPFTTRVTINQNEVKQVPITYEGAGIIGNYNVIARSVNSPLKFDNRTVRLIIDPFCARQAPSPAHQMVFTEFGCAYICPNYGQRDLSGNLIDVFDASCGQITDYDRCIYEDVNGTRTCTTAKTYNGIHCTDIGKFKEQDGYMDDVKSGNVAAFVPAQMEHKYFIVSADNKGVCQYVNEYGYVNGVPVDELDFDYAAGFPAGSEVSPATPPPTANVIPGSSPSPVSPPSGGGAITLPDDLWKYLLAGAGLMIGVLLGYILTHRRR